MKKIAFIIAAFLLTTFSCAHADDRSDQLSQESSSTFSPGYINAAKYQAESLRTINFPDDKKKGAFESAMDNIKNAMGYRARENMAAGEDLNPALQQKTSGQNPNASAALGETFDLGLSGEDDVPAWMRERASQYFTSVGANITNPQTDTIIKYNSGNEKFYVFWLETSRVKAQIFDSAGAASTTDPILMGTASSGSLKNIVVLSDGRIALYTSRRVSDNTFGITCKVFEMNGAMSTPETEIIKGASSLVTISKVSKLKNGNIALLWNGLDYQSNNNFMAQILGTSGIQKVGSATNFGSGGSVAVARVAQFASGKIGVFWYESSTEYNQIFKTRLLNSDGSFCSQNATEITKADGDSFVVFKDAVQLADGRVAVLYSGTAGDEYYWGTGLKILNSDGTSTSSTFSVGVPSAGNFQTIVALADGNIAVVWSHIVDDPNTGESYGTINSQVFNLKTGKGSAINSILGDVTVNKVVALDNGKMAIIWTDIPGIRMEMLDSQGRVINNTLKTISANRFDTIKSVTMLENGNFAVLWTAGLYLKAQLFDKNGQALSVTPTILGTNAVTVYNITTLDTGGIAVFIKSGSAFQNKVLDSIGNFAPSDVLTIPTANMGLRDLGKALLSNPFLNPFKLNEVLGGGVYGQSKDSLMDGKGVADMLKSMLMGGQGVQMPGDMLSPEAMANMAKNALAQLGVTSPAQVIDFKDMEIMKSIAAILKNPTADQKIVINAVTSLLNDINKVEGQAGPNPELKKASDRLLQAVANILLAQAIPDLLKEGDVANIKGIFANLDSTKGKILIEYNESAKPYYEEVKRVLMKNADALHLSNILDKDMLTKELEKMPVSELDKILAKIKAKQKKTAEEEYVLQQEAKFRIKHLDPSKERFKKDMSAMLDEFAKQLSAALSGIKK